MEHSLKRYKLSKLNLDNEEELREYARKQKYIPPIRGLLNRRLVENYNLLPGSERIILNEFHRRCTQGPQYRPSVKKDAFYFALRSEMSEDVIEMHNSVDIRHKLKCIELNNHQMIIRSLLKTNMVLIEKLLRWKYEYLQSHKIQDKEKAFKFETLFRFFILRRKEIHNLLYETNNYISVIINRTHESELYIKKAVRLLNGKYC